MLNTSSPFMTLFDLPGNREYSVKGVDLLLILLFAIALE